MKVASVIAGLLAVEAWHEQGVKLPARLPDDDLDTCGKPLHCANLVPADDQHHFLTFDAFAEKERDENSVVVHVRPGEQHYVGIGTMVARSVEGADTRGLYTDGPAAYRGKKGFGGFIVRASHGQFVGHSLELARSPSLCNGGVDKGPTHLENIAIVSALECAYGNQNDEMLHTVNAIYYNGAGNWEDSKVDNPRTGTRGFTKKDENGNFLYPDGREMDDVRWGMKWTAPDITEIGTEHNLEVTFDAWWTILNTTDDNGCPNYRKASTKLIVDAPTSAPTMAPTTGTPTMAPTTANPTAAPTAAPTPMKMDGGKAVQIHIPDEDFERPVVDIETNQGLEGWMSSSSPGRYVRTAGHDGVDTLMWKPPSAWVGVPPVGLANNGKAGNGLLLDWSLASGEMAESGGNAGAPTDFYLNMNLGAPWHDADMEDHDDKMDFVAQVWAYLPSSNQLPNDAEAIVYMAAHGEGTDTNPRGIIFEQAKIGRQHVPDKWFEVTVKLSVHGDDFKAKNKADVHGVSKGGAIKATFGFELVQDRNARGKGSIIFDELKLFAHESHAEDTGVKHATDPSRLADAGAETSPASWVSPSLALLSVVAAMLR